MPVRFTEADDRRVRENNHAARRKGSITNAIREWHAIQGDKPFHLDELREFVRSKRCILMTIRSWNVEQKTLMRLHKRGECPLDMDATSVREQVYRFER